MWGGATCWVNSTMDACLQARSSHHLTCTLSSIGIGVVLKCDDCKCRSACRLMGCFAEAVLSTPRILAAFTASLAQHASRIIGRTR